MVGAVQMGYLSGDPGAGVASGVDGALGVVVVAGAEVGGGVVVAAGTVVGGVDRGGAPAAVDEVDPQAPSANAVARSAPGRRSRRPSRRSGCGTEVICPALFLTRRALSAPGIPAGKTPGVAIRLQHD